MWMPQDPRLNPAPVKNTPDPKDVKSIEELIQKYGTQQQIKSFKEIALNTKKL